MIVENVLLHDSVYLLFLSELYHLPSIKSLDYHDYKFLLRPFMSTLSFVK